MTALDLIKDALKELNAINVADTPDGSIAEFALGKLNRIVDNLNAEGAEIYAHAITAYPLTPALQPHTIGTSGATWTATPPMQIDGANLILTTGERTPITIRDAAWWLNLVNPTLTGAIVTDLRYERAPWPLGSIYLWPVPTTAYQIELLTRIALATMTYATVFAMPPGYQDRITLDLAESLASPLGLQLPPDLRVRASRARARTQANNRPSARISTVDSGMPAAGSGDFYDYRIGPFQ